MSLTTFYNAVLGLAREYKGYNINKSDLRRMLHKNSYFRKDDIVEFTEALFNLIATAEPTYRSKTPRAPRPKPEERHEVQKKFRCTVCEEHYTVRHPFFPALYHCPKCSPCDHCRPSTKKLAKVSK